MVGLEDVRAAAERIKRYVVRTPLERSHALTERIGADVWLKYECFQYTGSFKIRGALNALLLLSTEQKQCGVITASAGNHGLGVARAANLLGLPAAVVVAKTASPAKIEALSHSGVELIQTGERYDDAEDAARRLARERDITYVSPYNDAAVIAGGGTVALEILEDVPVTQSIVVPAGGGGLISGISVAAHGISRDIKVLGVESVASPALHSALQAGRVVTVDVQPSLADGLGGNIEPDSITFGLLKEHVSEVRLVEEHEIATAMRWLLEREHALVEGAGAVGVAALLAQQASPRPPIVVVLTGRNVAAAVLQQYVLVR